MASTRGGLISVWHGALLRNQRALSRKPMFWQPYRCTTPGCWPRGIVALQRTLKNTVNHKESKSGVGTETREIPEHIDTFRLSTLQVLSTADISKGARLRPPDADPRGWLTSSRTYSVQPRSPRSQSSSSAPQTRCSWDRIGAPIWRCRSGGPANRCAWC